MNKIINALHEGHQMLKKEVNDFDTISKWHCTPERKKSLEETEAFKKLVIREMYLKSNLIKEVNNQ